MSESVLIAISASPHNREAGMRYEDVLVDNLGFTTDWIIDPADYGEEVTRMNLASYASWISAIFRKPAVQQKRRELINEADIVLAVNHETWAERIQHFLDPMAIADLEIANFQDKLAVVSDDYPRFLTPGQRRRYPIQDVVRDAYLNALGTRRALGDMSTMEVLFKEHQERKGAA